MSTLLVKTEKEHIDPKSSQVIIIVTGTAEGIMRELVHHVESAMNHGKPVQGTSLYGDCTVSIITPVWKGQQY